MAFGLVLGCGCWFVCHATQIAKLARNARAAARTPLPNLPGPEHEKPFAVPTDHRLWFDDSQCRAPVPPVSGKKPPQQTGRLGSSAFVCWRAERHRSGVGGRVSPAPRRDGIGTCIGEQRAVAEWKASTCNTGGGQPQSSQADRNLICGRPNRPCALLR